MWVQNNVNILQCTNSFGNICYQLKSRVASAPSPSRTPSTAATPTRRGGAHERAAGQVPVRPADPAGELREHWPSPSGSAAASVGQQQHRSRLLCFTFLVIFFLCLLQNSLIESVNCLWCWVEFRWTRSSYLVCMQNFCRPYDEEDRDIDV